MIYLNNAATTYPKPKSVIHAVNECLNSIPQGQFRSTFYDNETVEHQCKRRLGSLLGIKDYDLIYFTSGATEAYNLVINGLLLESKHIIATTNEHNAFLRPCINSLENVTIDYVHCNELGEVNPKCIEKLIRHDTVAIFVNHCSNVTGAIQDINAIGEIAKRFNLTYIVDASQSAGCIPINVDDGQIDILIFTGHKSLFGTSGIGGVYVKKTVPLMLTKFGGTGKDSHLLEVSKMSREIEVGTQNIPGIYALNEGLKYILNRGLHNIYMKERMIIHKLFNQLSELKYIVLYGFKDNINAPHGPIISFNVKGMRPSDIGYILSNSYNIIVRTGLHCAPLVHKDLGTYPEGTVRISISDLTKEEDMNRFLDAIREINNSIGVW